MDDRRGLDGEVCPRPDQFHPRAALSQRLRESLAQLDAAPAGAGLEGGAGKFPQQVSLRDLFSLRFYRWEKNILISC